MFAVRVTNAIAKIPVDILNFSFCLFFYIYLKYFLYSVIHEEVES